MSGKEWVEKNCAECSVDVMDCDHVNYGLAKKTECKFKNGFVNEPRRFKEFSREELYLLRLVLEKQCLYNLSSEINREIRLRENGSNS